MLLPLGCTLQDIVQHHTQDFTRMLHQGGSA
jgi:hypothetical protein